MDRREMLKMIAVMTGGAVIGGELFITGCGLSGTSDNLTFSEIDVAFLDEVAETILPRTKTPGAKDAKVGHFMTIMVKDCYTPADQKIFYSGIKELNEDAKKMSGGDFMELNPAQKSYLLEPIDRAAKVRQKEKAESEGMALPGAKIETHYFTMMKQLTLLGFFTSKIGANEALRFVAIPGRYDSCIPYKKGDAAWA
jgi:hypothetical protein